MDFNKKILEWYALHGRTNLPWQNPRSPYRVWVSEIMLQQTQVQTVIPYFSKFMDSFPDIQTLANASADAVLAHWSGLGYYSRARNLHKTAQIIYNDYAGIWPRTISELLMLPGIGESTAAAILSQAFNLPTAILDANVKRVLSRYFKVDGEPQQSQVKQRLWQLARECMPSDNCADYTQAIMDFGATYCTSRSPCCEKCPVQEHCMAYQHQEVSLYPNKSIKKKVPLRHQQFLLLYNENRELFLERKPNSGLWGGLWCLPQLDVEQDINDYLQKTYQIQGENQQFLTQLKHSFSHFKLIITAFSIQVTIPDACLRESSGSWFSIDQLHQIGLAKPVSNIINIFLQS